MVTEIKQNIFKQKMLPIFEVVNVPPLQKIAYFFHITFRTSEFDR